MIKEHDSVVLTRDLAAESLEAGDIGTVVHIHDGGAGYEVEFVTLAGETVTVITLMPSQIRAIAKRDIARVRTLQTA
jgi:mRNA-degrading endonuclease toxin of MazEF toxin-antitoxin module